MTKSRIKVVFSGSLFPKENHPDPISFMWYDSVCCMNGRLLAIRTDATGKDHVDCLGEQTLVHVLGSKFKKPCWEVKLDDDGTTGYYAGFAIGAEIREVPS